MSEKNRMFQHLLQKDGIVVCAGVYDAISARIAEQAGFDAVYMTGNGSMASLLGVPDIGLATMTDMVTRAHQISSAVNVPLFSDCDNGYGDLMQVHYAVRAFEDAGVSAIHIEDQAMPKKCGAMKDVRVISAEEMCDKIRIAKAARKDPNFVICARTDSNVVYGIDEVVRRCKMFAEAGADLVYPEMVRNKEDILKITTAVDAPIVYDHFEAGDRNLFSIQELEQLGIKLVFNCLSATFVVCKQLQKFYQYYKENGNTLGYLDEMVSREEYEELLGLSDYLKIGTPYACRK